MDAHKAKLLAVEKMREHGLFGKGWLFRFNNRKRSAGRALERTNGEKWIELSRPFVELNSEEQIVETILHEIAHALRGAKFGHDHEWRRIARSIGCTGERCYDASEMNVVKGIGRWLCEACGMKQEIHRRPKAGMRLACRKCLTRHGRTRENRLRFELKLEFYGVGE